MKMSNLFRYSCHAAVMTALFIGQTLPAYELNPRLSAADLLIQKARSLEARDRADLAAQVWQQVLVTNPNQPDALAGLARWAKRSGKNDEANAYLGRLRKVSPDASALAQLDSSESTHKASGKLNEAAKLTAAGHSEEAMQIYREVFGSTPPPGGWAIAYYETLGNTAGGFDAAVAALRQLATSYPDVTSYQVAAGRLMTYRPASRQAGIALLSSVSGSTAAAAKAREAWRQALTWEKANPAYAASIDAYLSRYSDSDLQAAASAMRARVAASERLTPETHEEQVGYSALKSGNLAEAERQFAAAVSKDDKSGRAHAGLGFARMKAADFDGAVQQFEAALKAIPNDATVRSSLEAARFWQAMHKGAAAADAGEWAQAVESYQSAVGLRTNSFEAERALGGALLAAGSPAKAIAHLTAAVRSKNADESTWCALATAKLQSEGGKSALALMQTVPAALAVSLNQKISWKALEASAYAERGDDPRASEIYRGLIASDPARLTWAEQIQLASLALHFRQPAQALPFARSAFDANPNDAGAWEVLLPSLVGSGRPQEAERVYARMPDKLRKSAGTKPGFLEALASLNESNGDLDGTRTYLEQVLALPGASAHESSQRSTRLHLALVLAKLGKGAEAETIVNAVADNHPDDADVWRTHFLILQTLNRQNEIVAVASRMPQPVAVHLGTEGDMVTLLARAHSAAGNSGFAVKLLDTYITHAGANDPSDCLAQRIQLAWILLDAPAQSGRLYGLLDALNARSDLDAERRKEVTSLWVTWIQRSSEAARRSGNEVRELGLLEQGLNMFPGNADLERSLAGNLLAAGKTKRAFNVYCNWGLSDAHASDFAGAIGAALAERDAQYADSWLAAGLAQWPNDPKLLELAGERAKARGDLKKAEFYWKEALAQKKAQSQDSALAQDAGQAPLKKLLVDADVAHGAVAEPAAASFARDQDTPRVHLSSFSGASATREDFVRSNAFAGAPVTATAAIRSNLLLNAELPVAPASDSLEDKIASLESRNSPYLTSRMSVWGRGGEPGFGRLVMEQAEFEASTTLANSFRASLLLKPTYLTGGTATGSGETLFGRQTSAASFGTQNASGVAAEAQLSSQSLGLRIGTTPEGFLTHNWVGGLRVQPKDGPITILLERDSLKDTMLAYAGAKDPQSGQIWGGVMANTASLQARWGDNHSGIYANGGYQELDGRNVARNTGINGSLGTWWKVAALPAGDLTLGMNFSAMHYDRNLRYFTFGQGGYFSPQQYFLFNVPVRWTGTYNHRLQYTLGGSLGLQHFVEDASDYYPTDSLLQARTGNRYAALASTGANFNFDARVMYQMAPHWLLGAFANASNARNYTASAAGLFVRYTFEERPMSFDNALPSVPDWRGQQPFQLF